MCVQTHSHTGGCILSCPGVHITMSVVFSIVPKCVSNDLFEGFLCSSSSVLIKSHFSWNGFLKGSEFESRSLNFTHINQLNALMNIFRGQTAVLLHCLRFWSYLLFGTLNKLNLFSDLDIFCNFTLKNKKSYVEIHFNGSISPGVRLWK